MLRTLPLTVLLLASCAVPSSGWHRTDLGPFSLELPDDTHQVPVRAIDSYVGEFANATMKVSFDYGAWSDPLTSNYGTVITRDSLTIGTRAALIVAWRRPAEKSSAILAGVHFPGREADDAKLTVYAEFEEEASIGTARKIFESIRFRNK